MDHCSLQPGTTVLLNRKTENTKYIVRYQFTMRKHRLWYVLYVHENRRTQHNTQRNNNSNAPHTNAAPHHSTPLTEFGDATTSVTPSSVSMLLLFIVVTCCWESDVLLAACLQPIVRKLKTPHPRLSMPVGSKDKRLVRRNKLGTQNAAAADASIYAHSKHSRDFPLRCTVSNT